MTNNVLTTSRTKSLAQCPRKHWLAYELGIRPERDSRALRIGSALHGALDVIKCNGLVTFPEQGDLSDLEYTCVCVMISGWAWRWGVDPVTVIESEHTYQLPLRHPNRNRAMRGWRVAGQIDGLVEWQGRTVVMEHKTTGVDIGPDSSYWRRLRMDLQCSNYLVAAKQLGYEVEGVLYDVMRKPSLRLNQVPLLDGDGLKVVLDAEGNRVLKADGTPRQSADAKQGYVLQSREESVDEWYDRILQDMTERPDYYFARQYVCRLDAEAEEAQLDGWHWAETVKHHRKMKYWPRNTNACTDFGLCPYFDICADGVDVTQGIPEGFVKLDNVHPELGGF